MIQDTDKLALQEQAQRVLALDLKQIEPYLQDTQVQEIMINSPESVFIERAGRFEQVDLRFSPDKITSVITTLSRINDKRVALVLDCRLPGLRIAATLPPVAIRGPAMSIRRHSARLFSLEDYLKQGVFNVQTSSIPASSNFEGEIEDAQQMMQFLHWLLSGRTNFMVTGSTSSGKTAFLNTLAQLIPSEQRVITIEDTAELKIPVENWLAFEANPAHKVDVRMLVKHALRNRPNRIWVGEGRGAEFYDILDAYNTGHPGSAVTFHSDSAAMALPRLENMVRMAPEASNWPLEDLRRQIASTFSYVIHCACIDGRRGPAEIMQIQGVEANQYQIKTLFRRA